MRISDWIADLCSSDLRAGRRLHPPGMERRVAIVGTVAAAIVETAAHRRVAAETQFRQYRRAIGPETVAPGAINRRRDVEPVADRIAQRRHLRPLQCGRKIAGIAVVLEIGRAHVELQSLMRISYAVFCLNKKKQTR